jgi:hypothetical protein
MFSGYEPFIPVLYLRYIILYALFFVSHVFSFLLISISVFYAGFVIGSCAFEPAG